MLAHPIRTFALASLVAFSLAVGCGTGRTVLPVRIDTASTVGPTESQRLTTHDQAVRGIAAVLVNDLGLPVPEQVTVFVYSSREIFEQGLIQDAHVSPLRAAELSDFAVGVGRRRQLLLYDGGLQRRDREWLRLIAHELAHVSQIELARGEGRAEQWLAEGMAEWVAFTVLERFGLDTVSRRRVVAGSAVAVHAPVVTARLDLGTLGSSRGFTLRHRREGALPTYQLSFLMADYLIAREGLPRVIDYFRAFAKRADRLENFQQAFGQRLEDFETEVLSHLRTPGH